MIILKILFIAPLPPPITGQSLASQVFLDSINDAHDVSVVNFSKNGFKEGATSLGRFWDIFKVLSSVLKKKSESEIIYLTISESLAGNLKDLLTYLICFRRLPRFFIHLHGGSIGKLLFDRYPILRRLNAYFIGKMGGVIILGKSHMCIFTGMIDFDRIHIVPNFAEDIFFCTEGEIIAKYNSGGPLRILYLSNLIEGKGYKELLSAFEMLEETERSDIKIDFAGAFESEGEKKAFLDRILKFPEIVYHDVVRGEIKKKLLQEAHVFCIPTGFSEGQPISILEAYASGCVVISTMMGGIVDIFTDQVNGFTIKDKSAMSVKIALQNTLMNRRHLLKIGKNNSREALLKYRMQTFNQSLQKIIGNA